MPTYDYVCKKCRHRFEEVQPFSSEPVAACPNCGGGAQRQFTVPVVVYKGSGFYTTDHGRGSANGSASKKSDGDGSAKASGDSSSKASGDGSAKASGDSPAKSSTEKAEAGSSHTH